MENYIPLPFNNHPKIPSQCNLLIIINFLNPVIIYRGDRCFSISHHTEYS